MEDFKWLTLFRGVYVCVNDGHNTSSKTKHYELKYVVLGRLILVSSKDGKAGVLMG